MKEDTEALNILELLPHRYPFILIDRVISYVPFDYLHAIKNVSMNEPCFTGHFPGNPIMPGVFILEAMAQAGAILSKLSEEPNSNRELLHYFAGVDKARFKHIVKPGDQLRIEVNMLAHKKDIWRMHCKAMVGEKLACVADLLSASKEVKRDL